MRTGGNAQIPEEMRTMVFISSVLNRAFIGFILNSQGRMMNRDVLIKLYDFNLRVIEINLEGVTQEESLFQPERAGNCINWVSGHIVTTRNLMMKLIGENPAWGEDKTALYQRGAKPLTHADKAIPLAEMLNDLRNSQVVLIKKLKKMTIEELEAPAEDSTVFEQLAFLQFHETYHAGQLGLLRRLIGKPGAIT